MTQYDDACPLQIVTLNRDGTLTTPDNGAMETGTWSKDRQTKAITLTFDHYDVTYTGDKDRRCYQGTMTSPSNNTSGVWRGCRQ
jgi:hypothetical protein